jgi:SpoVK/Ycf46/Vps4 family AAA+-type ATPase
VANRTDDCFIRVIGSELVQKYVGEGARMVRELFQVKNCCILVFIPLIVTMPSYVKNKMFTIADGPFKEGLHCVF